MPFPAMSPLSAVPPLPDSTPSGGPRAPLQPARPLGLLTPPPPPPWDPAALLRLLVALTAMRDHLDRVLQDADSLNDQVESLARALLRGQTPPLDPVLRWLDQVSAGLGAARALLAPVPVLVRRVGATVGTPALPERTIEGLLALIDALALLHPYSLGGPAQRQRFRTLRASAQRALNDALRGRDLRPALAELAEHHTRLLAEGEAARVASARLGEGIEALLGG